MDNAQQYMDPQAVRSKMQIPPNLREAYDKIVRAGVTGMFAPKMRKATLDVIEQSHSDPDAVGDQMGKMMLMILQRSNNTMPPQLIIPAGIELLAHAVQVAKKGGYEFTADQFAEAVAAMVETIFKAVGVSPDQLPALMQQQGGAA